MSIYGNPKWFRCVCVCVCDDMVVKLHIQMIASHDKSCDEKQTLRAYTIWVREIGVLCAFVKRKKRPNEIIWESEINCIGIIIHACINVLKESVRSIGRSVGRSVVVNKCMKSSNENKYTLMCMCMCVLVFWNRF